MKTKLLLVFFLLASLLTTVHAQTSDEVLNLLIQKKLISQEEADSMREESAIKQQDKPKDKTFTVGIEFRPRAEYRNGYRYLREDSTSANLQVLGRTRLLFTYEQDKKFKFHTSIQDIRTWGQYDPKYTGATLQVFEAYAQVNLTPKITTKIGRQTIILDNQRLFAQNDWRPNGNAHDGLSFHYVGERLQTSVYGAFNQSSPDVYFGTDFRPTFSNYKYLGVYYLKYQINKAFTFTTINALDGFEDKKIIAKNYNRYTNGGRLEAQNRNFYATFAGYYQWGQDNAGKELEAWYIQPEVKYTNLQYKGNIRLGMEVFSGQDGTDKSITKDNSFVPLYGVAHRFNGYMDFFTTFPADLNNAGLVNPYLFIEKNIGSKLSLQACFHLFYSQNKFVNTSKQLQHPYLGFENDYVLTYTPNNYTEIQLGVCYANMTASAAAMKQPTASTLDPTNKTTKGGDPNLIPMFSYLQIKFTPQLFKAKF